MKLSDLLMHPGTRNVSLGRGGSKQGTAGREENVSVGTQRDGEDVAGSGSADCEVREERSRRSNSPGPIPGGTEEGKGKLRKGQE